MNIVDKILLEAYGFLDQIPNEFSFVMRDTTKFPTPELKWDAVKAIKKAMAGKDTIKRKIAVNTLVKTQNNDGKLFAVKFHDTYYLIRGLIPSDKKEIDCSIFDLDSANIGIKVQTSYSR